VIVSQGAFDEAAQLHPAEVTTLTEPAAALPFNEAFGGFIEKLQVEMGVMVTVAPIFVLEMALPADELAIPLVSCTFEDVFKVDGEIVNVTVATMPAEIAVWFRPYNTQVDVPATLLQESAFPAAVAAPPATALTAEKSDAG
jgi:hypothetical protein